MRMRIGLIIIISLITLWFTGCSGGSDDWTDPILLQFSLGTTPVRSGETVNVPLAQTTKMKFEFDRPVTFASLERLLSFQIWVENINTGIAAYYTECSLEANGDLVWPTSSGKVIEFRLNHPMSENSAGASMGYPGDTFRVTVTNLVGEAADGTHFALMMDEFFVVWAGTGPDPTDDEWSDGILERLFIGNVEVEPGRTANVPLSDIETIRFEFNEKISQSSLSQMFDFEIWIENLDSSSAAILTKTNLNQNGELHWPDTSNLVIEVHMDHDMSYFWSGGQKVYLGEPGDRYQVTVNYLTGRAQDGSTFNLHGDMFYVIHSLSGTSP